MKVNKIWMCMTVAAMPALCSCFSDEHDFNLTPTSETEYGSVSFDLDANAKFEANTRSLSEDSYRNSDNYNIKLVRTTDGNELLACKYNELGSLLPKKLEIDSYRVEATCGKEHAFSRDEFLMAGSTTFTIKAGEDKEVNVNCTPTCGKLNVAFADAMSTYFDEYSVTYAGTEAMGTNTCTWAKGDTEPWYVALKESGETLQYTINLTAKDEYLNKNAEGNTTKESVVKGTITLERNKAHRLTITPNYTPTTDGGMTIVITIDESTNDKNVEWSVPVTWI